MENLNPALSTAEGVQNKGRVALYLPSLRGGGAERVMVLLANGLAKRGYLVDLVVAKAEGPYLSEVHSGVRVVDLVCRRVAQSLPGLVRYLRRERPVAMLSALNHANVISCFAHRLARVSTRLIISEHNTLSESRPQNARGRLVPWLMRWVYPWADGIVAVSQGVSDDLVHHLNIDACLVQVIYNPVVDDTLLIKAKQTPAHPWFKQGEPPLVLGVGRLTEQKDFETLIRAFALVRAQRMVRLMILGEGELRPQLETLVSQLGLGNDVALPGFVANPFAYMARASVFVLSSRWEGLPTVLIEAMACGVPVVSTDCPSGPREILEGGRWGQLVPVANVSALAKVLPLTIDKFDVPDVMIRAMDFGVDQSVQKYLTLMLKKYEQVESSKKSS